VRREKKKTHCYQGIFRGAGSSEKEWTSFGERWLSRTWILLAAAEGEVKAGSIVTVFSKHTKKKKRRKRESS